MLKNHQEPQTRTSTYWSKDKTETWVSHHENVPVPVEQLYLAAHAQETSVGVSEVPARQPAACWPRREVLWGHEEQLTTQLRPVTESRHPESTKEQANNTNLALPVF